MQFPAMFNVAIPLVSIHSLTSWRVLSSLRSNEMEITIQGFLCSSHSFLANFSPGVDEAAAKGIVLSVSWTLIAVRAGYPASEHSTKVMAALCFFSGCFNHPSSDAYSLRFLVSVLIV